ncbi:TetR/AcrR family transcriptional regulator [Streptosporangium lutulentum]|uniref:TetR/AcrR family transcriptional repressor of nem operon n=1 Tax=Streptosporangium lutulentum TaxID=1461250 RepID=A0ABT9Q788_9ACTN|nr:TetR/AcrR family transcriptional regulator [Streptosporangium lutulentum]MDP9842612.1 TetR/AcrR family transcriptional repressor of nem operon [Streptosporangium lutulentum]
MARRSMREEIVEAGLEQFHAHGYSAAGVKNITDAAGVPKGSFYNHFDSKEALAVVALERYAEGLRLRELADTSVEPLTRLRAHFEFLRDENVRRGITRGCLVGNFSAEVADHSDVIHTAVRNSFRQWAVLIAAALGEARRAGTVRADLDPETTARFVLHAWEGTLLGARADRSAEAFDSFFDLVFGTLLVK